MTPILPVPPRPLSGDVRRIDRLRKGGLERRDEAPERRPMRRRAPLPDDDQEAPEDGRVDVLG